MRPPTDFGSDQSKSFAADARAWAARPEPDHRRSTTEPESRDRHAQQDSSRPWQDRTTDERTARDRSQPNRPARDRPFESRSGQQSDRSSSRERSTEGGRSGGAPHRAPGRTDEGAPRFERREPDRGSRVREDEIGERWPDVPEWADPHELDPEVRRDLRGLSKEGSEFVAGHLFMAGMLAEEDPSLAWRHARAARSKGGRIAVVRETVGLVAYRAGEWAEAIAELRAARRMSGGPGQLPVMADCERALGHPEKAIELSRSAEAAELDPSSAAEMTIVVAGARADMGQLEAALANLESAVRTTDVEPYTARLFYAYADLLLQAERRDEAIEYFMKAADLDVDEETDAGERLTELADEEADLSGTETTDFVADDDEQLDPSDELFVKSDVVSDSDRDNNDDNDNGNRSGSGSGSYIDEANDGTGERVDDRADAQDVDGAVQSRSSRRPDDGNFYSDPAEQDKLLMGAGDDEEDDTAVRAEALTGTDPDARPAAAGLSAEQAAHLDQDDERAQADTEVPTPVEVPDGSAAPDAVLAPDASPAPDAVPAPATQVPDGTDESKRPAANPHLTGSLFSHHEGGL